jgi:hypothetical protein
MSTENPPGYDDLRTPELRSMLALESIAASLEKLVAMAELLRDNERLSQGVSSIKDLDKSLSEFIERFFHSVR